MDTETLDLERAARSPTIAQLVTALAAAQGAFPLIPRDREVKVQPRKRDDGTYPPPYFFTYAPLATILEKVRPALAANGLALSQSVVVVNEKGHEAVRTVLYHASGEFLANETPLFVGKADNASQGYASGLTYARRYGVTTLLCIAADDDDDAGGTEDDDADRQRANAGRNGPRGSNKPAGKPPVQQPQERKPQDLDKERSPAAEGAPLAPGPKRLLDAKAKAAGLDEAGLAAKYPQGITMANLNTVLAELSALANGGE